MLSIRIQPDEGISLKFVSKVPGPTMRAAPVPMEFRYGTSFGAEPPEAYERLLLDCMLGDGTLFTRGDEVEASWSWIDRIEKAWSALPPPPFPNYAAGTWGPADADRLIEGEGRVLEKAVMADDTDRLQLFEQGGAIEVPVGRIEAELAALWRRAAEARPGQIPKAVTRACLWNLVVRVRGEAEFVHAKKVIDESGAAHSGAHHRHAHRARPARFAARVGRGQLAAQRRRRSGLGLRRGDAVGLGQGGRARAVVGALAALYGRADGDVLDGGAAVDGARWCASWCTRPIG